MAARVGRVGDAHRVERVGDGAGEARRGEGQALPPEAAHIAVVRAAPHRGRRVHRCEGRLARTAAAGSAAGSTAAAARATRATRTAVGAAIRAACAAARAACDAAVAGAAARGHRQLASPPGRRRPTRCAGRARRAVRFGPGGQLRRRSGRGAARGASAPSGARPTARAA